MIVYIIIIFLILYLYKYQISNHNQIGNHSQINNHDQINNHTPPPIYHFNNENKSNIFKEQKCQKPLLTNYSCFLNKCDLCPMGSFKQCSNNYSYKNYPPNTNCSCYSVSQDLCQNKYSQKCLLEKKICNYWAKKKKYN